jgi:gliding motility-associated-like protein
MRYSVIIIILSILFFASCTEKDEIYPRSNETIFITVDHDTSIALLDNQTYVFDAGTGDSNSTYSWILNSWNSQSQLNYSSVIINYPGWFEVDILTDTIHTIFSIYLYYAESSIYYPNSFSPDGDGMNDFWFPKGTNLNLDDFLVKIYDKNDHFLYETDQFYQPWDGTVEGIPCPAGFYYYVVKYKTATGEKHKDSGMIQLIR